jgi:hypothetical protein
MSNLNYTIVGSGDEQNITVLVPGVDLTQTQAHSSHPNFKAIVAAVLGDEPVSTDELVRLFDTGQAVAEKFAKLSDRVMVSGGKVYFDGDEIDNSLTQQIVRQLNEGTVGSDGDAAAWVGLVNFIENVQNNPQEHSREQLYDWLATRPFTITDHGMIVGYKGVRRTDDGYQSVSAGREPVTVTDEDGNVEVRTGHILQQLGDEVSMPRSMVQHDPSVGCHVGLHVGTYDYAKSWGEVLLEVHIDPRDVVSVPTDCAAQKMRTCRYTVIQEVAAPYSEPVITGYAALSAENDNYEDDYEDDDYQDDFDW